MKFIVRNSQKPNDKLRHSSISEMRALYIFSAFLILYFIQQRFDSDVIIGESHFRAKRTSGRSSSDEKSRISMPRAYPPVGQ